MNDEQAGPLESDPLLEQDASMPLLEEARAIEKDMYRIMNTQVRLAMAQVVLATLSILTALIVAALR